MTDKEKIRAEVVRLKEEISIGLSAYDAGEENGKWELCEKIISYIDSMPGESVSEDLEKAAKRYATEGDELSGLYIIDEEVEAFKAGARWQFGQLEKKRLAACDRQTDDARKAVEIAKEEMIEKVCVFS